MAENIFNHPMLMQYHLPLLSEETKKHLPSPDTINFDALKVACVLELVQWWFSDPTHVFSQAINIDLALLSKAILSFDPKNGKHYISKRLKIASLLKNDFPSNHPIWLLVTLDKKTS